MYKLFSVDDHIVEPPGVWVDRVPAAYKDRVPHVIEADGRQMWVWEGGMEMTMGLNAVAGKPREQWGAEPARFEDMIPGCYDPHQRRKDFLSNGVFASVAFPTLPGFAGRKFGTFEDKDLALVCVRAWNDFILDEWCPVAPEMYVPMTIAPVWDAQLATEETARCIEKGSKALCWMEDPANIGLPGYHTDYWHPLFAVCQDADIPVCMHIGGALPRVTLDGTIPMVEIAAAFAHAARSATNMMVSPIPRKFPRIKLVWSEGGIGWITAALERADRQWDRHQRLARYLLIQDQLFRLRGLQVPGEAGQLVRAPDRQAQRDADLVGQSLVPLVGQIAVHWLVAAGAGAGATADQLPHHPELARRHP